MSENGIRIVEMTTDDPRFVEVRDFIYTIMYEPFGIPEDGMWSRFEEGARFKVALDPADAVVGCARLLPIDEQGVGVVRTVATAPSVRRTGLGSLLMRLVEEDALSQGASSLRLNARIPALGFYESLGYVIVSEEFINPPSGLLHRTMVKDLQPHALSA